MVTFICWYLVNPVGWEWPDRDWGKVPSRLVEVKLVNYANVFNLFWPVKNNRFTILFCQCEKHLIDGEKNYIGKPNNVSMKRRSEWASKIDNLIGFTTNITKPNPNMKWNKNRDVTKTSSGPISIRLVRYKTKESNRLPISRKTLFLSLNIVLPHGWNILYEFLS